MSRFARGAALNAIVRRFPRSRVTKTDRHAFNAWGQSVPVLSEMSGVRATRWYRQLWTLDGRCAFSQCLSLLPDPDKLARSNGGDDVFSVGVKDHRGGNSTVRAFISGNRPHAYTCLRFLIGTYHANSLLVTLFRHYCVLFHRRERGCKAARGKRDINMLLPIKDLDPMEVEESG